MLLAYCNNMKVQMRLIHQKTGGAKSRITVPLITTGNNGFKKMFGF